MRARVGALRCALLAFCAVHASFGQPAPADLDDRWEGGIDRFGNLSCAIRNATGKPCRSKENCVAEVSRNEEEFCLKENMERPFLGKYAQNWSKGVYTCSCCNATLFDSIDKFQTNEGYATFSSGVLLAVGYKHHENSWWMHPSDTGLHCENCGAHIGNVREDGPPPLERRYYVNSACLRLYCTLPHCAVNKTEHVASIRVGKMWRSIPPRDPFEGRRRKVIVGSVICLVLTAVVLFFVACSRCMRRLCPHRHHRKYRSVPTHEMAERDVDSDQHEG